MRPKTRSSVEPFQRGVDHQETDNEIFEKRADDLARCTPGA